MPRTPEFDREAVLTGAMSTFWEYGYEATSMSDLLAATGLSKSSLYAGFGGKHELFLASYDRYRARKGEHLHELLERTPGPEGIRVFFEEIITGQIDPRERFGCMTTNLAAERGFRDETVCTRVNEDYQALEDAFASHLRSGQDDGTVPADADVLAAASALVTAFSGFQLTVRADLDRSRLRRALEYVLAPLTLPAD